MRKHALLLLTVASLATSAGCRQPGAPSSQAGTRPATEVSTADSTDPRQMRFNRVDMLITQWDVAQAGGRLEQAEALFQRVRSEVDAAYCDFEALSQGKESISLQYLGTSALGFSARPEATRALMAVLEERDAQLLGNALIALKLRADPSTPLEPILKHVVSPAKAPRRYAPLAIANIVEARYRRGIRTTPQMEKAAMHVLSGVVADRDPYVRLHVAKALGAFRAQAGYELLMILMKDNEIRIRIAAAAGLERLGDYRGFPSVIRLLGDAPEESKCAIRDILASYALRIQGAPISPPELTRLGMNVVAWTQWFNALCRQRGYVVEEGRDPGCVPSPCRPAGPTSPASPMSPPAVQPMPAPRAPGMLPAPPAPPPSGFPSPRPAPVVR